MSMYVIRVKPGMDCEVAACESEDTLSAVRSEPCPSGKTVPGQTGQNRFFPDICF